MAEWKWPQFIEFRCVCVCVAVRELSVLMSMNGALVHSPVIKMIFKADMRDHAE